MPTGAVAKQSLPAHLFAGVNHMSSHPLSRRSDRHPISAVFSCQSLRDSSRESHFDLAGSTRRTLRDETPRAEIGRLTIWQTAYDQGRQTWARVGLSYEQFISHVQSLGHCVAPPHAVDLYLTAACRHGCRDAFQVLEQDFIERARNVVRHLVRDTCLVDDVLQEVRRRLFVGLPSKLVSYKGTGPLGSWIRTIAVNAARDYLRTESTRRRREEAQVCSLFHDASDLPAQDDSLALCIVRRGRRTACLNAARNAFLSLEPSERQLLHDHYLCGFSIDVLAPLCLVNRATVARRIHRATDAVRRRLRKHLAELYPREDSMTLDGLALAACRELLVDAATLLDTPPSPNVSD
jgi:RNA polymerase sigma-70 factor